MSQFSLKYKLFLQRIVLLFFIILFVTKCTDLSTTPDTNSSNSKINIISPVENGNLQIGDNTITYSLVQPYSIKFIEVYINNEFDKNIPPNSNGNAPQVSIKFDSSDIGKNISLYLIYYDNDGTSSKSNIIKNISITKDLRIPFKPFNLSIINLANGTINLNWKDSSRYIDKYEVWRKIDLSGTYTLHQELSGNSFNTNDYDLDTNKIYFYKVRGIKSSGAGEFSNEINSAGIITSGNLFPPTNLTANLIGNSGVQLNWKDNSDNENYFSIERSINNLTFINVANVLANTTSSPDTNSNLIAGTNYYYRIKSYSNSDSAVSNTVQIKYLNSVLIAPSNLSGNYNSSIGVIEFSWVNNDNSTVYIDIEKRTETSQYSLLRRVNANTSLFLDFSVSANNIYYYRVRGYDLNTYSLYSNEIMVSTY